MKVIPAFSYDFLLRPQRSLPLELKQSRWINMMYDKKHRAEYREIQLMGLRSPGSVLAAGSTSGHGRRLPQPSTAHTPTGASSTHPPVTERGAAAPPPGRPTTRHQPQLNCTSLSWVEVSSESSGSVTKMFPVADQQLLFGLNCDREKLLGSYT